MRMGRSHMGYIVKIAGMPMIWRYSIQKSVARSPKVSEPRALSEATEAALWTKDVFEWLGCKTKSPVHAHTDNMPTVMLLQRPVTGKPSSYDCIQDARYVFECVDKEQVKVQYVQAKHNKADIITKALKPGTLVRQTDRRYIACSSLAAVAILCSVRAPCSGSCRTPTPST